jgi:ABC-type Na+ efflux pump permease subunit
MQRAEEAMKNTLLILRRELGNFVQSERSSFVIQAVLVILWGAMVARNMQQLALEANVLWWVFFSVIVSSTFANATFVSERLSGSLEILLTCGVERRAILAGKIAYVILMSCLLGALSLGFSAACTLFSSSDAQSFFAAASPWRLAYLYLTACFVNASCCAWLSVRLANPRLSAFANLLVLSVIVCGHALLSAVWPASAWSLPLVLVCAGGLFLFFAVRDFGGERVIQPYSF